MNTGYAYLEDGTKVSLEGGDLYCTSAYSAYDNEIHKITEFDSGVSIYHHDCIGISNGQYNNRVTIDFSGDDVFSIKRMVVPHVEQLFILNDIIIEEPFDLPPTIKSVYIPISAVVRNLEDFLESDVDINFFMLDRVG